MQDGLAVCAQNRVASGLHGLVRLARFDSYAGRRQATVFDL